MPIQDVIGTAGRYWDSVRGGRALPSRRDLDPAEIPRILPFVMLVDVEPEPLDFRFRLIGTEIQAIVARHTRGRSFSSIPFMAPGNPIWSEYEWVVDSRRPLVSALSYVGNDRFVQKLRHCLMPLSSDGGAVDMIFVAVEIKRHG